MSDKLNSPEPWGVVEIDERYADIYCEGYKITSVPIADAHRIVACVNSLAGVPANDLPKVRACWEGEKLRAENAPRERLPGPVRSHFGHKPEAHPGQRARREGNMSEEPMIVVTEEIVDSAPAATFVIDVRLWYEGDVLHLHLVKIKGSTCP